MLSPLIRRYTPGTVLAVLHPHFIALCGTAPPCRWLGDVKLQSRSRSGMVAAALIRLDDRLAGRLRNLIITLICFLSRRLLWSCSFTAVAICVEQRYPPTGLFCWEDWNAIRIAFGVTHCHLYDAGYLCRSHWYQQPLLLLAGAVIVRFLLTLTGHLLFPRSVRCRIIWRTSYEQLAHYLEQLKSRLFDPDIEDESERRSMI